MTKTDSRDLEAVARDFVNVNSRLFWKVLNCDVP